MKKLSALALMLAPAAAFADGVANIMTAKSIPASTVSVIDPETGTSSGGAGTDVKYAVGDIISFRFRFFPVPDHKSNGMGAYLTEYVPNNLQVVGFRILENDTDDARSIPPRYPGISLDGGCTGQCRHGTISQVYADTGLFYTTSAISTDELWRDPQAQFIRLNNGIGIVEPKQAQAMAAILSADRFDIRAHNKWDAANVNVFGAQAETDFGAGSPVAGTGTFYQNDNNGTGPWRRIIYPGSLVGTGVMDGSGAVRRTVLSASTLSAGLLTTVSPASPLPWSSTTNYTTALRASLGDVRVGKPGVVEVSFRVMGAPLDTRHVSASSPSGADVNCGELFGGDTTLDNPSGNGNGAKDNPWATFLPSPGCVFLNLLFDLTVNDYAGGCGNTVQFTLRGTNLSTVTQTFSDPNNPDGDVYIGYNGSDGTPTVVSALKDPGTPSQMTLSSSLTTCPNGELSGLSCIRFNMPTLNPSADYEIKVNWKISGCGALTNVIKALYISDQLRGGYSTQAIALTKIVSVIETDVKAPDNANVPGTGGDVTISGFLRNTGKANTSTTQLGFFLPGASWIVKNVTAAGSLRCAGPISGSTQNPLVPTVCNTGVTLNGMSSVPFSFTVTVPNGTTGGLYPIHTHVWWDDTVSGGLVENFFPDVAWVPVGGVRPLAPTIDCPIDTNDGAITGDGAPAGATVRVYIDGIVRGQTTANADGTWSVSLSSGWTFGSIYPGLEITATVEVGGLESVMSLSCEVDQGRPACNDGVDNDDPEDTRIDFPDDPGCTSLFDNDETNPGNMQCSNTVDDADAEDTIADWPSDLGCFGPTDTDETDVIDNTAPDCADAADNDNDGKKDFPADPGCHSLNDDSEVDPTESRSDFPPRILFVVDTSGSMNFDVCDETGTHFAGGDGSAECTGTHGNAGCAAATAGNGTDSRIYKVKVGMSDVIAGFGEVEYGMMRFFQRAVASFVCPVAFPAVSQSGTWQGAGGIGDDAMGTRECPGFDAGELLVGFSKDDNRYDMLQWLDNSSNWSGAIRTAPPKRDFELRGTGTTPLGGALSTARGYLTEFTDGDGTGDDPKASCRPYKVVLLTDGRDTCGGNPVNEADLLQAALEPNNPNAPVVYVIGFGTLAGPIVTQLNAIASAGGTGPLAILVDDSAELSAAISGIIGDSILVERCNGVDDDCDDDVDEGFPTGSCNNGLLGRCALSGSIQCTGDFTTGCVLAPCALQGGCGPLTEVCNQIDDDCDGMVDEGLSCPNCLEEVCNGFDDDCDTVVDDGNMPGVGQPCGVDEGACELGTVECRGTMGLQCIGALGPTAERCNGVDDDCDGQIDGMIDVCYLANTAGCEPAPMGMGGFLCHGVCSPGLSACTNGQPGTCTGAVGPTTELCNGLNDDCDVDPNGVELVDEDFNAGQVCFSNGIGACRTQGVFVCAVDGMSSFCTAPIVMGSTEVCNGIDDDCDGMTDEDLGEPIGEACGGSAGCGAGFFVCERGTIVCTGGGTGAAEVCDALDNDCDGFVDEAPLPNLGDPCPPEGVPVPVKGECKNGMLICTGGDMVCTGAVGPTPEVCDGKDNDCDGVGDDMAACPSPTDACVMGTCVQACREGEFPCGFGFRCRTLPEGRFCVPNPCDFITCPSGQTCNVDTAMCEDPCDKVTCDAPRKCFGGRCVDCFVLGCPEAQFCRASTSGVGECQVDRCANVNCPTGQFCRDGTCTSLTCTPECASGSVCVNGQCQVQTCDIENCRGRSCPTGQACNPTDGRCIPDPCVTTQCPDGFNCSVICGGVSVCTEPGVTPGDPDETVKVLATGGGGMACEIGAVAQGTKSYSWLLAFGLVALVLRRRRRGSK